MDYVVRLGEECKIRGLSPCTLKAYVFWAGKYLAFCRAYSLNPSIECVKSYLLSLEGATASNRQAYAALRFFFAHVLKQPFTLEQVPVQKQLKPLPRVISKEQVKQLILLTGNVKHRLVLSMLYATGMRLEELTNLKRADIDIDRNIVRIVRGKGGKDRITLLAQSIRTELLKYYSKQQFTTPYVFEGRKGKNYSKKSVQLIVERAGERIGIKLTPHMLRHSFATHLLESGVDIRHIQTLLGHKDVRTTEIYTHISKRYIERIKNPLDEL